MKTAKIVALGLSVIMSALAFPITALSLSDPADTVTGESGRSYEEITLPDGTATGVRYTEMSLNGYYGSNKVLRLAECDLSNTNLSIDVLNCGTYTVSKSTVASAANSFSTNGKTVLAALNGDMWMTGVNSNSNVTKKTLQTTRGVMIIDREIWATQEFGMENYMNTSNAGTTASLKSAFGVTDENQPLVGAPVITVKVTNETKDKTLTADGLNRLPAWDSLVVYNHRINSSNYALDDSYEIQLVCENTSFTLDNNVEARVVAIYPQGSSSRPSIGENSIILTARGSRVSELSETYQIGDIVSFDLTLEDKYGNTEIWQNVSDAIGGHIQVIQDDTRTYFDTNSSEYPASLIGIKDDGTVMFANINSSSNGVYKGLRFKDAYSLCSELGYNSVFYLDGGGSSSIVTLKEGTYTQRNYSADGTPRSVINAVAMVWNDTPVCDEQGSLAYITTDDELSDISPEFIPAGILERIVKYSNAIDHRYMYDEKLLRINPSVFTGDPYIGFELSVFSEYIDTAKYKYITLKLKTNIDVTTQFALYYYTDAQTSIQNITTQVSPSPSDIWVTFNMVNSQGWSGSLTELRLDIFEGITSSPGQYVDIEYLAFCATPKDITRLQNGIYPEGSIKDYYAYKGCGIQHNFTLFDTKDSSSHTKECSSCGYFISETHTYSDEYTVDIEPTYSSVGIGSRHCLYCDFKTDIITIPKLKMKGDVNGDGSVNSLDSNSLSKHISGNTVTPPPANPDINDDGTVNIVDINFLKRLLAGV